jgi:hypothetical protein
MRDKDSIDEPLSSEKAWEFARSFIDACNRQDPDAILAHYALNVELRSPLVVRLLGDRSGIVRGRDALRAYLTKTFVGQPKDLRFELLDVFYGVRDIFLYYRGVGDRLIAETMELNTKGLAVQVVVSYQASEGS